MRLLFLVAALVVAACSTTSTTGSGTSTHCPPATKPGRPCWER